MKSTRIKILIFCFLSINILFFGMNIKKRTTLAIPKQIWQTYRHHELPPKALKCQNSWKMKNPEYEYHFMDDQEIENYIRQNWDEDTLNFFKSCPVGAMKADLWRYLIVATEGGVYSDIDTKCKVPISKWSSKINNLVKQEHQFIISLEKGCKEAFCQWTFAASKNHPALKHICQHVVQNWKTKGIDLDNPHFVHQTTGPTIWTSGIASYLGEPLNTPAIDIYEKYLSDKDYRKKCNKLGVFIVPARFFQGQMSENRFGGDLFNDGYIGWKKELVEIFKSRESTEWKKVWEDK
jgi:inositol phosphorylceramide mannosyltransferase catalytic subunit